MKDKSRVFLSEIISSHSRIFLVAKNTKVCNVADTNASIASLA